MSIENEIKVVEAEVVQEVKEVKEVPVNEIEKTKASILAQKDTFTKQLSQIRTEMSNLQKQFEDKKILGVRVEGALEGLEILLKSLEK